MLKFKKHDKEQESPERRSSRREDDEKRSSRRRDRSRSRSRSPRRREGSPYSAERRRRGSRSRSPGRRERRRSRSRSPSRREKSKPSSEKPKKPKPTPQYNLIELEVNDRLGKKVRVKCSPKDTVGDFKKLVAAQIGTDPHKIVLKKWYKEYKDHITLEDYELNNGMNLELYYR
ncbi:hypothetical protein VTP01DRAFT_453 [Rhizomucor pusillus]|uniref:uncharacterized protein n=1 Tax=Rhizomucor pusillus TaxID=4840 RepID=UPI0037448980